MQDPFNTLAAAFRPLPDLGASFSMMKLQDELAAIPGDSFLACVIRDGALTNMRETIKMIQDQSADPLSRPGMVRVVGEELILKIEKL
jgi:hypothetical protein